MTTKLNEVTTDGPDELDISEETLAIMAGSDPVHTTKHYNVYVTHFDGDSDSTDFAFEAAGNKYATWYEVVNTKTGVTEIKTTILPQAISAATEFNGMMEEAPWKEKVIESAPEGLVQAIGRS